MTARFFYDDLVEIDSLYVAIEELGVDEEMRAELESLIDRQLHHTILDLVLSKLTPEDKQLFLDHHSRAEHDKVWGLLRARIENVEDEITRVSKELVKELHEDIHQKTDSA